ncbi:MAG: two-component sensor histidine kinase [Actinobacteria bacterium]|uniref:histidine kinase n=1 Tax=freshwater metagenome TaxID=449393 RepID=A0A6J7FAN5_9ZZZZ|nr:two-component sensor histidine kinase [Actinomycetota bacterium]
MTVSLVLMLLVLGAIAGALIAVLIFWALQLRQRAARAARDAETTGLTWGIVDTFAMIDVPTVLVDAHMNVKAASDAALSLAMLGSGRVTAPELMAIVKEAFSSQQTVAREIELSRGPFAEAAIRVEVRAAKMSSNLVLLFMADRSEYQRLEEVRRDFIANISHELKTPIGAISLLAEALIEASDDPDMVRNFSLRLGGEAERLAGITREIIELSRLQADGAIIAFESVDLNSVVAQAVDQHRIFAASKGIDIVVGKSGQVTLLADETRLVLAVSNLVSNAVQYSPDGSRVGVGITHTDGHVEISVTDQGIGMTKEESERVFERFYRTDQARSRTTGGTGLGLSIVKHIVANHGGDIRLWTQPGAGSTFTIRLPEAAPSGEEKSVA